MFEGSLPALITPFKDGLVDEDGFRAFVEWQIEEGSDGLVPCGTTGESPTLSHAEHMKVTEICIEQAKGRVPVIAGAGSNSTAEAVELAKHAKEAGADIVGMDDLAAQIKGGEMNFDVVVASPDAMRVVGQLGQILGPRGLMPNPKTGTVTPDVVTAVKNAKAGQVRYRNDKNGIIHASIGKVAFEPQQIQENLESLLDALRKAKPASAKGTYIKKVSLSTTMGAGVAVDQSTLVD